MLTRLLIVALLWTASIGALPAFVPSGLPAPAERAIAQVASDELRRHVEQLASDAFAGRGLGQPGNERAERYIADAFTHAGVPPAGSAYYQPVGIHTSSLGRGSRLTISSADGTPLVELENGADFYPLPASAHGEISGPLVFAGHGLSGPGRHDDYKDLNVRGAVAIVLEGAPAWIQQSLALTPEEKSDLGALERKLANARAHGAAGLLIVREYLGGVSSAWPRMHYQVIDQRGQAPPIVAALSGSAAAAIRKALDAGTHLTARLVTAIELAPVRANNVLGMIEGRDPGPAC